MAQARSTWPSGNGWAPLAVPTSFELGGVTRKTFPDGERYRRLESDVAGRDVVVWLAGLNPGVLEVVRHAGLDEKLGRDRMLFNARAAIERYQAMQAVAGSAPPPGAS